MDTFISPLPAVFLLMSFSQPVYFHNFIFFLSFWLVFFHVGFFCGSSLLLFLILMINFCEYSHKHNLLDIFLFQMLIPIRLAKLSCDCRVCDFV